MTIPTRLTAAAMASLFAASAAHAAPTVTSPATYTFSTVGTSTVENGASGNVSTFGTTTSSSLKLSVTAWQASQSTNKVTSAYLGTYAGGLGVTGTNDFGGAYNLHQIDNLTGYTDFLLFEFNQAVTLTSITTNSYGIFGVTQNDAAWYNASKVSTPAWNSTTGFASNVFLPAGWHDVADGASGAARNTGAVMASTKWLVGAAIDPSCDRYDNFKIAAITVTQAAPVPEPATWATMILGLGVAGTVLRRARRRAGATAIA